MKQRIQNLSLPLALLGALAAASTAQDIIVVPDDQPTIKAAIAAASNGGTVLVEPGTYHESDIRFNGKIIEVRSTGGPEVTIVDGDFNNRIFRFTGGETSNTLLEGFTIRDGQAPSGGGTVGDGGGGILIANGSPTIRDCHIINCYADVGSNTSPGTGYHGGHAGGLYIFTGSPLVEKCRFEANIAGTGGIGATGAAGSGGGVFSAPTAGSTGRTGGRGGHGGAVYLEVGSPSFVNCVFRFNRSGAGGRGGRGGRGGNAGAWAGRGANGGRGGTGGQGGNGSAMFVASGSPQLLNCTVINHSLAPRGAGGSGGSGGSSVFGNGSTGSTGTVGLFGVWSGVSMTSGEVRNAIFWANQGAELPVNNSVSYSCVEGALYNGPGNINSDPLLSTYDLLAGSPCIDAGDNGEVPAGLSVDMNDEPRFVDERLTVDVGQGTGAIVDMGADEFATNYVLPYGCGNPDNSLSVSAGAPTVGGSITLVLDRSEPARAAAGVPLMARAGLIIGTAPLDEGCGLPIRGDFLQVDLSQPWSRQWADRPWRGESLEIELQVPADPALIGSSLFVQGAAVRLSPKGELNGVMRLTNSLELVVGP